MSTITVTVAPVLMRRRVVLDEPEPTTEAIGEPYRPLRVERLSPWVKGPGRHRLRRASVPARDLLGLGPRRAVEPGFLRAVGHVFQAVAVAAVAVLVVL